MPGRTRRHIRVLVADEYTVTRRGVAHILDAARDISVVAEFTPGDEAVEGARELKPDVVMLDVDAGSTSGLSLIRRIASESPNTGILVFTTIDSERALFQAIQAGASGYLLKTASVDDLLDAIRRVHAGEVFIGPRMTSRFVNDFVSHLRTTRGEDPFRELTRREREILPMLAAGDTNEAIAARLRLSPHTVRTHRQRIMEKLDLHDKAELARFAMRRGLIQ